MSRVGNYRLYCITEETYVEGWGESPPTVCYNNPEHAIDDTSITEVDSRIRRCTLFQGFGFNTNLGDYALRNVADNQDTFFSFMAHFDLGSLVSLDLTVATQNAFTDKVIKFYSDYGAIGESPTQHSESDVTHQYTAPAVKWCALDISMVFSELSADDVCGLRVHPYNVGTDFKCVGIRMIDEMEQT